MTLRSPTRRYRVRALVVVALLAGSGCTAADDSGPAPTPSRRPTPSVTPTPTPSPTRAPTQIADVWRPILTEDFDSLDQARWRVRDRTYSSNESSYLLGENVTVANGLLRIQARDQSAGGRSFTSGALTTDGGLELPAYFRAEVRAKVPMQQGLWAAPLWFRPADRSGGEIDLVETFGKEADLPSVHQTLHTDYGSTHEQSVRSTDFSSLGDPTGTAWHTYVVEKVPGSITMWTDGVQTATWSQGDPSWFDEYYEAGKSWTLRANLQIGGYGGQPDATTDWRADRSAMFVDYVKAWARR